MTTASFPPVDLFNDEAISSMEQLLATNESHMAEDFDSKVDFHGHGFTENYQEVVDHD